MLYLKKRTLRFTSRFSLYVSQSLRLLTFHLVSAKLCASLFVTQLSLFALFTYLIFKRLSSFCFPRFGSAKVEKFLSFPNYILNLIWRAFPGQIAALAPLLPRFNLRFTTSISNPFSPAFQSKQPRFRSGCKDQNINLNLEMFFNIFSTFIFNSFSLLQ
jgi:hypothetical protein